MEISLIIIILTAHYISDFLMQTKMMAEKKSTNVYWLLTHCVTYGLGLGLILTISNFIGMITITGDFLRVFLLLNVVLHFIVDFITSRVTTKLYKKGKIRTFFNVIGLDQYIHTITLLLSFKYLNGIV